MQDETLGIRSVAQRLGLTKMKKKLPSSVTIEEAVARMVNMDDIPEGFTLLDMLDAFREKASVELDNSPYDEDLRNRLDTSTHRYTLAKSLIHEIESELKSGNSNLLKPSDDSSSVTRLTLSSVSDWSSDRYGIGLPDWEEKFSVPDGSTGRSEIDIPDREIILTSNTSIKKDTPWHEVQLKLRAKDRISVFHLGKNVRTMTYADTDLVNKTKNEPNILAEILLDLSHGIKYPVGRICERRHSAAVARLRKSLIKLTEINSNPFYEFNKTEGWKPKFKIVDDRRNADKRAKEKAVLVKFEKFENETGFTPDFEEEDDDAAKFIEGEL